MEFYLELFHSLNFFDYICKMEKIDISKLAPFGTKFCEGKCDRLTVHTPQGVKIICIGCERIVMEIKKP